MDYTDAELKTELESRGYVIVRASSYRAAQRRQQLAQNAWEWEKDRREGAERWARDSLQEERRLRDRLNEIIHLATLHGMTTDDLREFNRALGGASQPSLSDPPQPRSPGTTESPAPVASES